MRTHPVTVYEKVEIRGSQLNQGDLLFTVHLFYLLKIVQLMDKLMVLKVYLWLKKN